jgi:hypothetical protein
MPLARYIFLYQSVHRSYRNIKFSFTNSHCQQHTFFSFVAYCGRKRYQSSGMLAGLSISNIVSTLPSQSMPNLPHQINKPLEWYCISLLNLLVTSLREHCCSRQARGIFWTTKAGDQKHISIDWLLKTCLAQD